MKACASVRSLSVGPLAVNCYLLLDEESHDAAVIDPGGDGPSIMQMAEQAEAHISLILDTHGHCDHIGDNTYIREKTGARIGVHHLDAPFLEDTLLNGAQYMSLSCIPHKPDFTFSDGEELIVGGIRLCVIHTPGHTAGSSCFFIEDDGSGRPILFAGDTLFAGGIGRTDYYGGDAGEIMKSLKKLLTKIPPATFVYPGHGPAFNFGDECKSNPFLLEVRKFGPL